MKHAAKVFALFGLATAAIIAGTTRAQTPTTLPMAVVSGGTDLAVDRSFAVVVSKSTYSDPDWKPIADALAAKHAGTVIQYDGDVSTCLTGLKQTNPRYAAFVAKPTEAGRLFVMHVSRVTRQLNDDPYGDVIWGIVTGMTPADAMRVATVKDPLIMRKAGAGTGIDLKDFESGKWFSESKAGEVNSKEPGKPEEKSTGPTDSTSEIVDFLNNEHPDLFVTSGHASEHNWALGYSYKNGQFASKHGKMFGIDLTRKKYPVDSQNPKVFMAVGNCLMGHIDGDDSMALAWIGSGGVDQFVGYTVVTWYGAMGWGVNGYLFGSPGQFNVAESFYFSNQLLLHDLATKYPKALPINLDLPEKDGGNPDAGIDAADKAVNAACGELKEKQSQDRLGLVWDRDVVAFYGDPLWDARLAPSGPKVTTNLRLDGDVFHFTVSADDDYKPQKPIAMLLPHRLHGIKITGGDELKPVVTDNFVMLFDLPKLEKNKTYEVTFTASN